MENGTITGKFPNCISCILRSGDTEINFALLFWSIDLISKKRENFLFESIASISKVVYNFNDVTCSQFYGMTKNDSTLLAKVKRRSKYPWAKSNK